MCVFFLRPDGHYGSLLRLPVQVHIIKHIRMGRKHVPHLSFLELSDEAVFQDAQLFNPHTSDKHGACNNILFFFLP